MNFQTNVVVVNPIKTYFLKYLLYTSNPLTVLKKMYFGTTLWYFLGFKDFATKILEFTEISIKSSNIAKMESYSLDGLSPKGFPSLKD